MPEGKLTPDARETIVRQVCAALAGDGVAPGEVDVRDDGEIWVDRRGRDPRNVPFAVGRRAPRSG